MLAEQGLCTRGVGSAEGLSLTFVGIPKALTGRISAMQAFAYCTPPILLMKGFGKAHGRILNDLLLAMFDIALDRCLIEQCVWLDRAVAAMPVALPRKAARAQGDSKPWRKTETAQAFHRGAMYMFGKQAEVMFASHTWPRWGKERILQVMRGQRDMYANLNNQVLHLANSGVTIDQIQNVYAPPKSLLQLWFARGYHGSYQHNARGVMQRYLGFWDLNPATLDPLSPEDSAPMYVEMMGGVDKVMAKGKELYDQGKYRLAQELVNKLVLAQGTNQAARDLLADIFEQQGYHYESPSLRNSFLSAAKELRDGVVPKPVARPGPDFVRGTGTELFLEYLGIQVDSRKAAGLKFKINLSTPDNGEKFVIEMSNATLTAISGYQASDADLTLTINRSDLEQFMLGQATLAQLAQAGKAKLEGNAQVWQQLAGTLGAFDPWFEVFPGPKAVATQAGKPPRDPFVELIRPLATAD